MDVLTVVYWVAVLILSEVLYILMIKAFCVNKTRFVNWVEAKVISFGFSYISVALLFLIGEEIFVSFDKIVFAIKIAFIILFYFGLNYLLYRLILKFKVKE